MYEPLAIAVLSMSTPTKPPSSSDDAQGEEQAVALHLRRRHDLELARGRRGAAGAGARQRPDRGELAHAVAPFGEETFGGAQAGRGGSGVGVLLRSSGTSAPRVSRRR